IRVFFVNRARQHLNRTEKERAIFESRFFEIMNETLQIVGHAVERLRQFADLSTAIEMDSLREITAGDGAAGFCQHVQRSGQAARSKNSYEATEGNGNQRKRQRGTLHLKDINV